MKRSIEVPQANCSEETQLAEFARPQTSKALIATDAPALWLAAVMRPILGFRLRYLPLIMVLCLRCTRAHRRYARDGHLRSLAEETRFASLSDFWLLMENQVQ